MKVEVNMAEITCSCGASKMNFKHLTADDLPNGWQCPKCPQAKSTATSNITSDDAMTSVVSEKDSKKMPEVTAKRKRRGRPKKRKES